VQSVQAITRLGQRLQRVGEVHAAGPRCYNENFGYHQEFGGCDQRLHRRGHSQKLGKSSHRPTCVAAPTNHFQLFIASLVLVVMVGTNLGFGFLRDSTLSQHPARPAEPSQPAAPPMMGAAHQNPNQAYIWAPIGETPLRGRRNFLMGDATDTDNSPDMKAIMPQPQTPSARRSPTKGERGRSPNKMY